jgi:hypothetical protein
MKPFLMAAAALALGGTALLTGQNTSTPNNPVMGRGRGGAPYAWNDRNKDGICDVTGQPVGQGRGMCAMRCGRRGRAVNGGWGRGMGRRCQQQSQPQAAPAQK